MSGGERAARLAHRCETRSVIHLNGMSVGVLPWAMCCHNLAEIIIIRTKLALLAREAIRRHSDVALPS